MTAPECYLCLDIGTSAAKAALIGPQQRIVYQVSEAIVATSTQIHQCEQSADDWSRASQRALKRLAKKTPSNFRNVCAICITGQMHGAVLVDVNHQVLRSTILWNDGRAVSECDDIRTAMPDVQQVAGVDALPGLTAPQIMWIARNEPEMYSRVYHILLPKDYIRMKLTGTVATDITDAAGTLWFDQNKRRWSDRLLAASGMNRDLLPSIFESSAVISNTEIGLEQEWGLPAGIPVVAGAGDVVAGAVGIGAINDDDAFISLGTSAQLFVARERYVVPNLPLIHSFAHAIPNRWYQMAAMLNGASCLQWISDVIGANCVFTALTETSAAYSGPGKLIFLPYLSGERTPHNDPNARGVFFGMHPGTSSTDLVQAVLEGVMYTFLDAKQAFERAGTHLDNVAIIGGGSRSDFWSQLFADGLGISIVKYRDADIGPTLGAARLAEMAIKHKSPEFVCTKPIISRVYKPNSKHHKLYLERHKRFQSLYAALREEFFLRT